MKVINKFVDEISGREFAKREDAIKSEKKNAGIKKLFSFWKYPPKGKGCRFENGEWCYQRTYVDYLRLVDSIVKAVKDYEPWIAKQYESHGGIQRKHIGGGFMIGRYLDDGRSELYSWYRIISNICPKCFREWGQPYYANHCSCSMKPKEI
jgi:hypothetical protein